MREGVAMIKPSEDNKAPPLNADGSCPKCNISTGVSTRYDETECVYCGWIEYTNPGVVHNKVTDFQSSATRHMVMYGGRERQFKGKTLLMRLLTRKTDVLTGYGGSIKFIPTCPFCETATEMEFTSLSGKRREKGQSRYKCADGHRVSIVDKEFTDDLGRPSHKTYWE